MNYKNQKVSLNDSSFVLILKKRATVAGIDASNKFLDIVFALDQLHKQE